MFDTSPIPVTDLRWVEPPHPSLRATHHVITGREGSDLVFYVAMDDAVPGAIYRAQAWVFIPRSFRGTYVSMVFYGYQPLEAMSADLSVRNRWQLLFATVVVPAGESRVSPALLAGAQAGSQLLSAGWLISRVPAATPLI